MPVLRNEGTRGGGSKGRLKLRNVLVVGQVAVSLVLLIGASLLVRSLQSARTMDVGFDADRLAVLGVDLDLHGYDEEAGKAAASIRRRGHEADECRGTGNVHGGTHATQTL